MNKQEADTILLACKKHGIFLTMRKEGSVYLVNFNKKLEFTSFDAAKLFTNALVIEGKHKTVSKEHLNINNSSTNISFSNRPKKRKTDENASSFAERRSKFNN